LTKRSTVVDGKDLFQLAAEKQQKLDLEDMQV
jgi:hypothetical protein